MRKKRNIRTIVLLLLLISGLAVGMFGKTLLSTSDFFFQKENVFLGGSSAVPSGDGWIVTDPNWLQETAQGALGMDELVEIRSALEAYRATQRKVSVLDYGGATNRVYVREVAKFKLMRLIQSSEDPGVIVQAATLLGDLFAQDTIDFAKRNKKNEATEAYNRAADAFTTAILADPTETVNEEPKEHLEILIRMFLSAVRSGEDPGPPSNGPRGGSSDPGSGY